MRFGDLNIGDKFFRCSSVSDSTVVSGEFFEKKSLSSAYILAPGTLERTSSRRLFHKTFCGFAAAVEVRKILA